MYKEQQSNKEAKEKTMVDEVERLGELRLAGRHGQNRHGPQLPAAEGHPATHERMRALWARERRALTPWLPKGERGWGGARMANQGRRLPTSVSPRSSLCPSRPSCAQRRRSGRLTGLD